MNARLVSALLLLACSGGDKEDDGIVPLDETDADTDTDADSDTDADTDTDTDTDALCPPLPTSGPTTSVAAGSGLAAAVASASAGDTLLLEDGTHTVSGPLVIDKALTLRSASGDRDAVVIDGGGAGGDLVQITASGVTLASLTLTRSFDELVAVIPAGATLTDATLYDLVLKDPGRFAVAVRDDGAGHYAEGGELACSSVVLTDAGRDLVRGECDTGGLDARGVRSWSVRDSRFEGLWCENDPSGPAIRFTRGSRDVVAQRNVLADVAQGIVLGEGRDQLGRLWPDEPCGTTTYLQAVDASAWNNIVFSNATAIVGSNDGLVVGVAAETSCNVSILHNSVYSEDVPEGGSIHQRYATTSGIVANNLVSHDVLRLENALADSVSNAENAPFDSWWFPADGDFHTAPGATNAVDQGDPAHTLPDDVDGEPRDDGLPDIGADER